MVEFASAIIEGVTKTAEGVESVSELGKSLEVRGVTFDELPFQELGSSTGGEIQSKLEMQEQYEFELYMKDDIGLSQKTTEFGDSNYINEIRNQNEKIDKVLTGYEDSLKNNPSDLNYQRVDENIERYKGTVFEHELKDSLKDSFEVVEDKQQIIQTEWGETKPDVIVRGAKEDLSIGNLEIQKGEDLFIEAKCGSPEYIRNEMGHILKQVEGHEGNSLVLVTKDYLELSPEVRADFEHKLSEKGSHIYVADVSAADISMGLTSSLRL